MNRNFARGHPQTPSLIVVVTVKVSTRHPHSVYETPFPYRIDGAVSIRGPGSIIDTTHFGEVGSTRDASCDPRQIQFAMKLYY